MKKRRLFFAIALITVFAIFGIKYIFSIDRSKLVQDEDEVNISPVWNQLVSAAVNDGNLIMDLDGQSVPVSNNDLYMDSDRNIMIALDILPDTLSCAVHVYDNLNIRLEKGTDILIVGIGQKTATWNDSEIELDTEPVISGRRYYISLNTISQYFDYNLGWDYATNTVNISNERPDEKVYPFSYDYRLVGRSSSIHNQADLGTCWAFASLTALETALMPENPAIFSADHMTYHCGYNITQNDGGEYTMSMAYLLSWKGPVYEADDPYGDGTSPQDLDAVFHVQGIQLIESKNLDEIKKSCFLYGGVQSSLYMSVRDADGNESEFYDADKNSYCYMGAEKPNHDIVIVGWDDSYSAGNFATVPEGDGAFICVNSWGEQFGDNGYFYVSYYDSNIGMHNVVYTDIEATDNYDKIYQSDLCGWVGQLGYNRENAYFANVYEVEADETLEAVGFYATESNTQYEIYVVADFEGTESFDNKVLLTSGTFNNAGYYTVKLPTSIHLQAGHRCAVIVSITTPGSVHPVAIEYRADEEATQNVVIDDGEGYISLKGTHWECVEDAYDCNLCLKMYTNLEE